MGVGDIAALKPYKTDQKTIDKALQKLEGLDISDSRKKKIGLVLKESRFNGVYCDYLLSDDPEVFRDSLEHNRHFAKDASTYGIDLKVLEEGVPCDGITIKLDQANAFSWEKLVNYANELAKQMRKMHDFIITELRNPRYDRILVPEEDEWTVDYASLDLHDDTRAAFEEAAENVLASRGFKETAGKLKSISGQKWLGSDYPPDNMHDRIEDELMDELELLMHSGVRKAALKFFEKDFRRQLGDVIRLYDKYSRSGRLTSHDLDLLTEKGRHKERVEEIKSRLIDGCITLRQVFDFFLEDKYLYALEESNFPDVEYGTEEIINLEAHIAEYEHIFTSKLDNLGEVRYTIRPERLMPDDVTFGNDGGCCLAIGEEIYEPNTDVPFYMLDKATIVFGIYQQAGKRKERRTGILLAFATLDTDNDPVLLCNSCELSEASNPLGTAGLNRLVTYVNDYIQRFSEAAGFKRVAMGNHNYNTAKNFMDSRLLKVPDYSKEELMKLPDLEDTPKFYSEVLDNSDRVSQKSSYSRKGAWAFMVRT